MKNVKFLLKCILALLPILAVMCFTAALPFGYMDIEYPSWKYTGEVSDDVKSVFSDGPTTVFVTGKGDNGNDITDIKSAISENTTLILGDSRAMADIMPSEVDDETVVNLAVGGATSIEMYYTLNNYIKNNGNPGKVIIMFAPFHYTIIDNFWTRTAYFNYLSVADMKDLYSNAKAADSETLLRDGYQNDLISYRTRFPDKYLPALLNAHFFGRYSDNSNKYRELTVEHGYGEFGTEKGCSGFNYEVSYEHMHTTGDAVLLDIYMNRLLKLCSDSNIDTELLIPPMNESSYNALKPSYVAEFSDYLNTLQIKYPAILVDGNIPCYDDKYFGDASHLNREGAIKFTQSLF